jgi:hypothetical protein
MLPPEVLTQLRQWWKARPTRYDAGLPPQERWLFPGRRRGLHLTTRQLSRLFHETAEVAGAQSNDLARPQPAAVAERQHDVDLEIARLPDMASRRLASSGLMTSGSFCGSSRW